MRLATGWQFCSKVISKPLAPRTVTMFCSLRSAEAGFMALMYWPLSIRSLMKYNKQNHVLLMSAVIGFRAGSMPLRWKP